MHPTTCVICHGDLMKRVYRADDPGHPGMWTASKDTAASDPLHPGPEEWVGKVWCPQCGVLYNCDES